jgi:hypothetical protein
MKKGKEIFGANLMSLADYFDLIRGFHNDLWRSFVLLDNTEDLHFFTQVVDFWDLWEVRKIAGKDYSSKRVVACVEIEETHTS